MSKIEKAKSFKRSRAGLLLSLGITVFGAFGVIKDIRNARSESDTLKLVDAVVDAAATVTGAALLVRELSRLDSDDVLLG